MGNILYQPSLFYFHKKNSSKVFQMRNNCFCQPWQSAKVALQITELESV